jgi:Protein of unknown function (DUF2004)
MANYTLPHFGQIDVANLDEYYDVEIQFGSEGVQIDLNFENKTIDQNRLDAAKKFIDKISDFDIVNKKYIESDYNDEECDTVRTYVEHHLEEIAQDELSKLVDFKNKTIKPDKQLMKKLRLVRVGLYPDKEDQFAIFDYSIGKDLTNYLVVINTDENGKLDYMTMES